MRSRVRARRMRLAALILASMLVLLLPAASAAPPLPDVTCDIDDDLYQHCNVGDVHVVYGPGCVGVRVGGPAACTRLVPE